MRAYSIAIFLAGLACLLAGGCRAKADSTSSSGKIPWSRVQHVEVTSDAEGKQRQPADGVEGTIGPGASQSEVILAWGMPDYILDSLTDPERKVWQYPRAVVVFQGTKVEKVLAR